MIDEIKFKSLFKDYQNLVYNLCLHYVLNTEDAQDITQEVFVKVYQKYHLYNSDTASVKTWITRVTINHCLDFLKSKKTGKRFGFIISLFNIGADEPIESALNIDHPGILAEDKEDLGNLLQIIQSLPQKQKTVIILSKIEELPQKEIAAIMNISIKAVESLIHRAKLTIKLKLTNTKGF
jgi:RNA polymerase sigma-70 factor, ECF subfamily